MIILVVILDLFLSFFFFFFFKLTKFGKLHRVEITSSAVEQVFYPLFFGKVLRFFSLSNLRSIQDSSKRLCLRFTLLSRMRLRWSNVVINLSFIFFVAPLFSFAIP